MYPVWTYQYLIHTTLYKKLILDSANYHDILFVDVTSLQKHMEVYASSPFLIEDGNEKLMPVGVLKKNVKYTNTLRFL